VSLIGFSGLRLAPSAEEMNLTKKGKWVTRRLRWDEAQRMQINPPGDRFKDPK
jgi:hypothetical protein